MTDGSRTRAARLGAGWGAAALLAAAAAAFLALAAIETGFVGSGIGQTAPPASAAPEAGSFKPTEAQLKGLQIAPVETRSFRPERVTEGNIAIDDDLNTPVFSPYSGRVTRLIAKLGDAVAAGAPLFTVEATEFVQAANDLFAVARSRPFSRVTRSPSSVRVFRLAERSSFRLVPSNATEFGSKSGSKGRDMFLLPSPTSPICSGPLPAWSVRPGTGGWSRLIARVGRQHREVTDA